MNRPLKAQFVCLAQAWEWKSPRLLGSKGVPSVCSLSKSFSFHSSNIQRTHASVLIRGMGSRLGYSGLKGRFLILLSELSSLLIKLANEVEFGQVLSKPNSLYHSSTFINPRRTPVSSIQSKEYAGQFPRLIWCCKGCSPKHAGSDLLEYPILNSFLSQTVGVRGLRQFSIRRFRQYAVTHQHG